jgi:hypothetical protein
MSDSEGFILYQTTIFKKTAKILTVFHPAISSFVVLRRTEIPVFSCFTIRLAFGEQASTPADKFYQSCNSRKNKEIPLALP